MAIDRALYLIYHKEENVVPVQYKRFHIYTDSEYSINVITKKKQAKANLDLVQSCWKHLEEIYKKKYFLNFIHVKAHTNKDDYVSRWNALADKIARQEAEKKKQEIELSKIDNNEDNK